ncbi:MAG: HWE histidine kinase domain-containing protein [Tranquillimonas sp.]
MSDQLSSSRPEPVDLSNCEREQIQFLGCVQSFGCLVVITTGWTVQNVSENVAALLSIAPDDLIGTRPTDHLSPEAIHTLRGKVQTIGSEDDGVRVFDIALFGDERRYDAAIHRTNGTYLLDFERKSHSGQRGDLSMVQPLLAKVRKAGTVEGMCATAARGLWALTGFSRVMVYRFDADFSGKVIAECAAPGMDSYKGLHFPASDIPAQARALYRRNRLRIIPDVSAPVSPLVPDLDPMGRPVDLSMAVTRAVSPIHIEYLRNMDVASSMSISIMREGELWGMIACHHADPHYVDYETRSAVELFTQLLSYELNLQEERVEREQGERARLMHERLVTLFEAGADFATGLEVLAAEIGQVIEFDGMAVQNEGRYCTTGLVPEEGEFQALQRQLARLQEGQVFSSDHLGKHCPDCVDPDRGIGGLLALPINRHPRQHVMLFRRQVAQNVVWAGNPSKTVANAGRISPRKSFAAWQETVQGKSVPWTAIELHAAETLRVTLLELVLKQASDRNQVGRRRSERQEILISELNHRLRNVFGLVEGLVTQSRPEDPAAAAFARALSGRIRALARANEQAFAARDAAFSLNELLRIEAMAFAGDEARIVLDGPDCRLHAPLRSTLSLVLHELVTNSLKYGALSGRGGTVRVEVEPQGDGGVDFTWRECGGPAVTVPDRVGFGTTLITRTIPYELNGEASLDYRADGLRARFRLPARHVEGFETRGESLAPEDAAPAASVPAPSISGRALIVEDNLVIALNAEDALRQLGADEVVIAGNCRDAMRIVEGQKLALAIIDVDLGGENSSVVAEKLKERNVPFLVASGYDRVEDAHPAFAGAPVLHKPYSNESIGATLSRLR